MRARGNSSEFFYLYDVTLLFVFLHLHTQEQIFNLSRTTTPTFLSPHNTTFVFLLSIFATSTDDLLDIPQPSQISNMIGNINIPLSQLSISLYLSLQLPTWAEPWGLISPITTPTIYNHLTLPTSHSSPQASCLFLAIQGRRTEPQVVCKVSSARKKHLAESIFPHIK